MSASQPRNIVHLRPEQIQRRADARSINPDRVDQFVDSISDTGLQSPLSVRPAAASTNTRTERVYELLAGNHRYLALQRLKWEEIPVVINDVDDLHAELITIDENLCREALSPAQETATVARRKQIYEQLHPETVHGGDRKSSRQIGDLKPERFTKATADLTGRSERAVQRLVTRAEKIGPAALQQIVGTSLDSSGELEALAGLPADEQKSVVERASAGEKVSARLRSAADIAKQARRSGDRSFPDISRFPERRRPKLNDQKPKKQGSEDIGTTAQDDGAIKFIDRMAGTLSEELTERDLETLNAALRFFFADLRGAWDQFQAGQDRKGAIQALAAMWRLIALFKSPLAETLHVPILLLQDALCALDKNKVAPMLKPAPRSGRARSIGARAGLRGHAAGTVQHLMQAGLTQPQAYARLAKTLTKLGVRPERGPGQITATTIRHWCDEVAADVGRRSVAATVYDGMFTRDEHNRFLGLSSDGERQSSAIESLEGFVRAVLPEVRKPPNPTS
jgi:ParB-like chromosome segregation protein Spo0J